jgi:hypothetical protein
MRYAFWMPKATDTHSEYVTRITFPLQLHERVSMLRYMHTAQRGVRDESQGIVSITETVFSVRYDLGLKKQLRIEYDRL